MIFIPKLPLKLTLFLFSLSLLASDLGHLSQGSIRLKDGSTLHTYFAITDIEKRDGLSGVQKGQFGINDAMLFMYKRAEIRRFWMPDTYFDLDIIFINENQEVVYIASKMKASNKQTKSKEIDQTPEINSQYILEIRNDSPLTKKIHLSDKIIWTLTPNP